VGDVTPYGFQAPSNPQPISWRQPDPGEAAGALDAAVDLVALGVLFAQGRRAGWMVYDQQHMRLDFEEPTPQSGMGEETWVHRWERKLAQLRERREWFSRAAVYGFLAGVILALAGAAGSARSATAAQSRAVLVAVLVGFAFAWWASRRFPRRAWWAVSVAVFAVSVAVVADLISFRHGTGSLPVVPILALGLVCSASAAAGWRYAPAGVGALVRRYIAAGRGRAHRVEMEQWQARRSVFEQEQDARLANLEMFQWGPANVPPECRRIYIFGGSQRSWQSFVTVFTASLIGSSVPVTVLDLARRPAVEELTALATARGVRIDRQTLPIDADTSDLLHGMDRDRLVAAIVESVYGNQADPARGTRLGDYDLLQEICRALAGDDGAGCVSMARIALGLRAAMGEPVRPGDVAEDEVDPGAGALSGHEHQVLATETFGHESRREMLTRLRELKAAVETLGALRLDPLPRPPGPLRIVQAASAGRGARAEFVKELIVAAQVARIETNPGSVGTLVVVGADGLSADHLEHLAAVCTDAQVPLVLMFEHLRGDARKIVGGGGLVGLMRLGNDQEASAAADFIGREHKLVFSSRTWSSGESDSNSSATGAGGSTGTTDTTGTGSSATGEQVSTFGPRKPGGLFTKRTYGASASTSQAKSTGASWSDTETTTTGTSRSEADSVQRVHEHIVAAETLQQMPDFAMLLVDHVRGQEHPRVRPVETDTRIASLPGVSARPLPERPAVRAAAPRGAAQPELSGRPAPPSAVAGWSTGRDVELEPEPGRGGRGAYDTRWPYDTDPPRDRR
jgi:hypothetical protein